MPAVHVQDFGVRVYGLNDPGAFLRQTGPSGGSYAGRYICLNDTTGDLIYSNVDLLKVQHHDLVTKLNDKHQATLAAANNSRSNDREAFKKKLQEANSAMGSAGLTVHRAMLTVWAFRPTQMGLAPCSLLLS